MWYIDSGSPPFWVKILLFILSFIIIWLVGFLIKRSARRITFGSEANNGINLGVSTVQFLLLLFIGSFIFEVDSTAIFGMSALFGTAIGFAMSLVIGNIVAGFYLITVRPFGIGDLIMVKGTEGIVLEIGLNYSRLLKMDNSTIIIPNKSLLDANLINCSIQIKELKEQAANGFEVGFQSLLKDIAELQSHNQKLSDELLTELVGGKEIVQFPFTVQLKLNIVSPDISLAAVNERMDLLCDRWSEKLGYSPHYFFGKYIFRQDMRIILVADTPHQIFSSYPEFLEDLYVNVFAELQEVSA